MLFLAYVLIAVLMWNHRRLARGLDETMAAVGVLGDRLNAMERSAAGRAEEKGRAAEAGEESGRTPTPAAIAFPPLPPLPSLPLVEATMPPREVPATHPVPDEPRGWAPRAGEEQRPGSEPQADGGWQAHAPSSSFASSSSSMGTGQPATPVMPPPLPPSPSSETQEGTQADFQVPAQSPRNWEELIGGNILNKLGALILVIGIALFLSYSFARMGPAGRAFTSLGVSIAILASGLRLERSNTYRTVSRGLIAAGWAGLYFTSYAMYGMDAARIISNPVLGTVLMAGVGVAMVGHSLRYRVQSLSALAYGCIFAALALSESNPFAAVALLPLAVSMLYLAHRYSWNGLALFGAAATYATFLTRPDSGASLLAIQSMLLLFWLLFETFDILRARTAPRGDFLLFGVNALAGLGASAMLWHRMAPQDMWQFCAAGSTLYLVSAWVRFSRGENSFWEAPVTLSVLLAGLGIFAGVEGLWTALAYIALAQVVFLASLHLRHVLLRALSLLAFATAMVQIVTQAASQPETWSFGSATIDGWAISAAVLAAVFYFNRVIEPAARYFGFLASAGVAMILRSQLPERWAGFAVFALGGVLFELGLQRRLADFRWQGYLSGIAGALLACWSVFSSGSGWITFAAGVALIATSVRSSRWMPDLGAFERKALQAAVAVLSSLLLLASAEIFPTSYLSVSYAGVALSLVEIGIAFGIGAMVWQARILSLFPGVLALFLRDQQLANGLVQAALQWWLWFRVRVRWDSRVHGWLAVGGLMVLIERVSNGQHGLAWIAVGAGLTIAGRVLKVVDLRWQATFVGVIAGLYTFEAANPFPVVHPASLAAWFLLAMILEPREEKYLRPIYAVSTAALGAVAIERGVSGPMLTLCWSLEAIALLALGFPVRERALRLAGLAMLLGCIGKVFVYDLRNLETMYRILSFVGLGAVLIAVSFIYTRFKDQLRRYL